MYPDVYITPLSLQILDIDFPANYFDIRLRITIRQIGANRRGNRVLPGAPKAPQICLGPLSDLAVQNYLTLAPAWPEPQ